jgi:hypothetical protein
MIRVSFPVSEISDQLEAAIDLQIVAIHARIIEQKEHAVNDIAHRRPKAPAPE